jgi:hypothetical protein
MKDKVNQRQIEVLQARIASFKGMTFSCIIKRLALLHVLQAIGETYSEEKFRDKLSHLSIPAINALFSKDDSKAQEWEGARIELLNIKLTHESTGCSKALSTFVSGLVVKKNGVIAEQYKESAVYRYLMDSLPRFKHYDIDGYREHRKLHFMSKNKRDSAVSVDVEIAIKMNISIEHAEGLAAFSAAIGVLSQKFASPELARKNAYDPNRKTQYPSHLEQAVDEFNNKLVKAGLSDCSLALTDAYNLHYRLHANGYIRNIHNAIILMIENTRNVFNVSTMAEEEINDSVYTDKAREDAKVLLKTAANDCQYLSNSLTDLRKRLETELSDDRPMSNYAARFIIACVWESMNALVEYPAYKSVRMLKVRNYLFHEDLSVLKSPLPMERTTTYRSNSPRLLAQQLYIVTICLHHMLATSIQAPCESAVSGLSL